MIIYRDTVRLYRVTADGYNQNKTVASYCDVNAVFLSELGMTRSGFVSNVTSGSICYLDPEDDYVVNNYNRLEGVYLRASVYGQYEWYRIKEVVINRNHLLGDRVDNIEAYLDKVDPLYKVS